jgi:hypothetical protein
LNASSRWTCVTCGSVNEKTSSRLCEICGEETLEKVAKAGDGSWHASSHKHGSDVTVWRILGARSDLDLQHSPRKSPRRTSSPLTSNNSNPHSSQSLSPETCRAAFTSSGGPPPPTPTPQLTVTSSQLSSVSPTGMNASSSFCHGSVKYQVSRLAIVSKSVDPKRDRSRGLAPSEPGQWAPGAGGGEGAAASSVIAHSFPSRHDYQGNKRTPLISPSVSPHQSPRNEFYPQNTSTHCNNMGSPVQFMYWRRKDKERDGEFNNISSDSDSAWDLSTATVDDVLSSFERSIYGSISPRTSMECSESSLFTPGRRKVANSLPRATVGALTASSSQYTPIAHADTTMHMQHNIDADWIMDDVDTTQYRQHHDSDMVEIGVLGDNTLMVAEEAVGSEEVCVQMVWDEHAGSREEKILQTTVALAEICESLMKELHEAHCYIEQHMSGVSTPQVSASLAVMPPKSSSRFSDIESLHDKIPAGTGDQEDRMAISRSLSPIPGLQDERGYIPW